MRPTRGGERPPAASCSCSARAARARSAQRAREARALHPQHSRLRFGVCLGHDVGAEGGGMRVEERKRRSSHLLRLGPVGFGLGGRAVANVEEFQVSNFSVGFGVPVESGVGVEPFGVAPGVDLADIPMPGLFPDGVRVEFGVIEVDGGE
eukprot:2014078-Prymnesium_polylepis.3